MKSYVHTTWACLRTLNSPILAKQFHHSYPFIYRLVACQKDSMYVTRQKQIFYNPAVTEPISIIKFTVSTLGIGY
jgi:hypothetical protein